MCKKLICLTYFALVLGLALPNAAEAADPGLVAHWKFDEGGGNIATDEVGSVEGDVINATWTEGLFPNSKSALEFNGSDAYVDVVGHDWGTFNQVSIAVWLKFNSLPGPYNSIFHEDWSAGGIHFMVRSSGVIGFSLNGRGPNDYNSRAVLEAGETFHVIATYDITTGHTQIYINGVLESEGGSSPTASEIFLRSPFTIGSWNTARYWDGVLDDLRIYDHVVTEEEIPGIMAPMLAELASQPNPEDGATDACRNAVLSWTPGQYADKHDVYFGTDFNDVTDATTTVDPNNMYKGRQGPNSYPIADTLNLDFGQTYYWRVDEVNAPPTANTIHTGDVWSFTVEPFAYPIDANNITATASSSDSLTTGPENTINGSGLDESDLHSTVKTDMWLSGSESAGQAWIEYQFDKVYKLHEMWVWNSNTEFEFALGFGFRDVTIEYSTNGTDWAALEGVPEFAQASGSADYAHNTPVDLDGVSAKYVKITANSNWGTLTQYGLSEVRFFYIPVQAREPNPDSGATGVGPDVVLNWRAGRQAATHEVYLSSSREDVVDGTAPVNTVTEASYGPLDLELGETYYWKVNEVNEADVPASWEGDIWNFTTLEYLVVDDFEDYDTAANQIWFVWKDGIGYSDPAYPPSYPGNNTGSAVGDETTNNYMEQTIFHGGRYSMPLAYDNSGAGGKLRYSEIFREWSVPQNWTASGVKALTLYFYGDPANAPAPLYVAVEDSTGNIKDIAYNNGDPDAVLVGDWQEWNIALSEFSDAGVNLAAVKKMYIGLGNRASPTAGGTGKLYIDDIGLYPSRCVLSERSADFAKVDYVADCVVDCKELELMAENWLVAPIAPGDADLVAHYELDGDTDDSSGNGNHGVVAGDPQWVTGQISGALNFDGVDDYIDCGTSSAFDLTEVTVACWIKVTTFDKTWQAIVTKGDNSWRIHRWSNGNGINWAHTGLSPLSVGGSTNVNDGAWHHIAGTYDGTNRVLYVDGQVDASDTPTGTISVSTHPVLIGENAQATGRHWSGLIDDVRIYDYGLSGAEILYLAGKPAADLNKDMIVDFKDYAELAVWWLDEQLWP